MNLTPDTHRPSPGQLTHPHALQGWRKVAMRKSRALHPRLLRSIRLNCLTKFILCMLLSVALNTAMAPASAAAGNQQQRRSAIHPEVFVLDNGLTLVVHSDRSVPTVFVGVWYRVGSKDEPVGKAGFAHLFEHLMFQPTRNRNSEYFLPLSQAGATDINGVTNSDRTMYYQTVPSNALDLALWMESDRMANLGQSITQEHLDEQRAVVRNEKLQSELSGDGTAMRFYREHFFPAGHPYAHDTIGSMEDLDKASLDDVKQWFKDYYGASNAVLVLSGDVDPATAKQKVAHYFSDVAAGKPAARLQQWLPEFAQIKRDVVYQPSQITSIRRAWPVSNDNPRELTWLQLASGTLAGANNAFLNQRLINELKLATSVSAGLAKNQLSTTFSIFLTLQPGVDPIQASQALDATLLDYFTTNPPDRKRMQTIIQNSDKTFLHSLESNAAIGMMLGEDQLYDNDPTRFERQRQWAQQATPRDLQTVSRKWLGRPYYETLLLPQPIPAVTGTRVDRSKLPELSTAGVEVKFPPIAQTILSNGMRLVVAERHNLPLIEASVHFDTGSDADAGYVPGISSQVFKLLALGTQRYDATALAEQMAQTGVSFNATVSNRHSGFNWSMSSERAAPAFALAAEMLRHPTYPQTEIDKRIARLDVNHYFDTQEREPVNSVRDVFACALWGKDHPLGRITTREQGHRNHIPQHSHKLLSRFHNNELGPNNATLYVLGDITLEQARILAERSFGDWKPVKPSALEDSTRAPSHRTDARVILINAPDAKQSSILVGHLIAPLDPAKAEIESLMDAVFGSSFHSRLNMNLREDKGWTYGFTASVDNAGSGQRVFSAGGSVQTDMTAQSMVQILKEISDYVGTRPVTAEELQREQTAAIRSIPSSFTNGGAFLGSMISSHGHGLPYNYAEGTLQRLGAVTLEQVRERARATYRPDQLTWVVAGDLSRIETDIRALNLGKVEVQDIYGNKLR